MIVVKRYQVKKIRVRAKIQPEIFTLSDDVLAW